QALGPDVGPVLLDVPQARRPVPFPEDHPPARPHIGKRRPQAALPPVVHQDEEAAVSVIKRAGPHLSPSCYYCRTSQSHPTQTGMSQVGAWPFSWTSSGLRSRNGRRRSRLIHQYPSVDLLSQVESGFMAFSALCAYCIFMSVMWPRAAFFTNPAWNMRPSGNLSNRQPNNWTYCRIYIPKFETPLFTRSEEHTSE